MSANLAAVAGPVLAGILVSTIGFTATYSVDVVVTFAALFASLYLLPPLPPEPDAESRA